MKDKNYDDLSDENISILERILLKTGNPRLATVLALDLLLVGVDTVRAQLEKFTFQYFNYFFFVDFHRDSFHNISTFTKSRKTRQTV